MWISGIKRSSSLVASIFTHWSTSLTLSYLNKFLSGSFCVQGSQATFGCTTVWSFLWPSLEYGERDRQATRKCLLKRGRGRVVYGRREKRVQLWAMEGSRMRRSHIKKTRERLQHGQSLGHWEGLGLSEDLEGQCSRNTGDDTWERTVKMAWKLLVWLLLSHARESGYNPEKNVKALKML